MYTLQDRVHACTLQAESVHGACKEVCTRLHACTPRKTHAHRPLQSLQDSSNQAAPTPPAGYVPRKVLIFSGIWRTISETPTRRSRNTPRTSQSTSIQSVHACSPNRGDTPPSPLKTTKMARKGGRGYIPPEIECTPARFVCLQESGVRGSIRSQ